MTGQVNVGEVARRLDDVFNRFEQVANDLPHNFVSKELFDAAKEISTVRNEALREIIKAQDLRITQLEDDKTWLWRLIIGAIILAILGVVISTTVAVNKNHRTSTGTKQTMSVVA